MRLTERQTEVVAFIRTFWAEHGYSPSMQEIADGLTVAESTAFRAVLLLSQKGALAYTPGAKRSVRVLAETLH